MKIPITFTVNGFEHSIDVKPSSTLLDILRNDLELTGTNVGCGNGDCGCCTVIMNDLSVNACLVLAPEADGSKVLTIEGLADKGKLHPVQEAFVEEGAVQCGFCTPGMVMQAVSFLKHTPRPTEQNIKHGIAGNICRCTGYTKIVAAIMSAAKKMKKVRS